MGKHGLLGSAVLVYALLTSAALLSVAWGWQEALNGALWLGYVLGGFGLIRGKAWGRTLTLVCAGGSLMLVLALPITVEAKLNYYSPVWILGSLPALAILASALLVKLPPPQGVELQAPAGMDRKPRISQRTRHDIAYISFIVLGLIAIWTAYWALVDPDPGVIGFLVLIPFGIPLLLALVLGVGLSMVLWHDFRLITLTVLSMAMLVAVNSLPLKAFPIPLFAYAAACITMGLVWFTKYRRHCG